MRRPISLSSFLLSLFFFPHAFAVPEQAPILDSSPVTLREATIDDLDDITTVYVDAFKVGSAWKYVRQFADEVGPEYTWNCLREACHQVFLNASELSNATIINVISAPDTTSKRGEKVVSFAAWNFARVGPTSGNRFFSDKFSTSRWAQATMMSGFFPDLASATGSSTGRASPFNCSAHLDMNMTRALDYSNAMQAAERTYLFEPFARQLELSLLATHPDWDGHGFAARHLHWGKAKLAELNDGLEAFENRMPITLMGTPSGYPLYCSEGFEKLHNVTIERLDGEGLLWVEAMKYDGQTHW